MICMILLIMVLYMICMILLIMVLYNYDMYDIINYGTI